MRNLDIINIFMSFVVNFIHLMLFKAIPNV